MTTRVSRLVFLALFSSSILLPSLFGQGISPYPNAITDRVIHPETPKLPPPVNVVFRDPDFHSRMVRATDATTNFRLPGTYLRTAGDSSGNEWSSDSRKFYVLGEGGQLLAFAFNPSAMAISALPNAGGKGLLLPLRQGTFSFVDPDLIYGTTSKDPLTIKSYRFSTGVSTPVINTRNCGVQPPLGSGPSVVSDDDVNLSLAENRVSISEGGSQFGSHMFVVVYDKKLGCRWYNTQTGQIGGQWGTSGYATVSSPYLIRHAHLSRDGNYVVIAVSWFGWYVWNLSTLHVTACPESSHLQCDGYGALGYHTKINGPGVLDDMQVVKRPLNNLANITQLYSPIPSPSNWGQPLHFTWNNINVNDTAPICGSTYSYDGDPAIDQPYAGEIFCLETDGKASTIWRFAHNRAKYISPYFQTQPLGTVSRDGRFYLFTSDWDAQLGLGPEGWPRSDVFIVKLE
jgi:hypothetical protein